MFVCALHLYPATPGWGVQGWCVCFGSGFGCALPLLARVLGCVCVCVRALIVPRQSWLGCALWVCVLGPGFRLRSPTPGWGVGVCVCLCARSACTRPLLAGVRSVGVCAWTQVSAAPRHFWLRCWGVRVSVCALCLYPATPGLRVRSECVCLGSRLGCTPPFLAGVLGCVCVCVNARPACTPPLLGGVCGVGVCAWARVSAAPCHSWLGCWGVCVFVCTLRLYPATPGWRVASECVYLGSRLPCTPPLLAGVLGCVCVCVCAPLVPRHSWLGCAVSVCVLGLGFRLRLVTPGWGVGVWVCLCARSACTPPLLAWVCGVGLCAWARVSAEPRHSWTGCWGVCVLVCAPRLYPATPGWGVRCGCVCLGSGFSCASPLLAGVLGCVCVCARAPCLYPATPGWGVRCGCACLGLGFRCAPPLLAGVLGYVCVCVCAPLIPRHSLLGCAVWVYVLRLGFWLRPATPGWGVGVFVCLCARSACTPPLLAGVRGGCVRVCVRAPLVPRHCWLGCAVWVCVLGLGFLAAPRHSWLGCWGVCVFVCELCLYPTTPGWDVGICV